MPRLDGMTLWDDGMPRMDGMTLWDRGMPCLDGMTLWNRGHAVSGWYDSMKQGACRVWMV